MVGDEKNIERREAAEYSSERATDRSTGRHTRPARVRSRVSRRRPRDKRSAILKSSREHVFRPAAANWNIAAGPFEANAICSCMREWRVTNHSRVMSFLFDSSGTTLFPFNAVPPPPAPSAPPNLSPPPGTITN